MNSGKATYKMHVKHLCRAELRRFIADRLDIPRLLNARVLCLPGREAIEIAEVYDALGIKQKNITCLERNSAVYNELRRRYLEIKLRKQSFSQFASRRSSDTFDILALDFTGQIATFERDIYHFIANGHLAEEAIVFTNFIGAREASASKGLYFHWGSQQDVRRIVLEELHKFGNRRSASPQQYLDRLAKKLKPYAGKERSDPTLWGTNLSSLRSEAIHRAIEHSLTESRSGDLLDLYFHERDKNGNLTREANHFRTREIPDNQIPNDSRAKNILRAISRYNKKRDNAFPALLLYDLDKRLDKHVEALLRNSLRRKGCHTIDYRNLAQSWRIAIDCVLARTAVVLDSKSLKYVGDGGSPMYADVFHIRRIADFDFLKAHLRLEGKTVRALIAPLLALSLTRFLSLSRDIVRKVQIVKSFQTDSQPVDRVFLGAEKRRRENPTINQLGLVDQRQQALQALAAFPGATIEDVALPVRAKPMQVAAWKAHVTMGTYEVSEQGDDKEVSKLRRIYKSKSIAAGSQLPPDQIEVLAGIAYENGDYAYSLALNKVLAKRQPGSVRALNNLAVLLSSQSRASSALKVLDKALAIKPADRSSLFNKAAVLKDLRRLPEAIASLRTLLTSYPTDLDALIALGDILFQEQQYIDALKIFDTGLLKWPGNGLLILGKAKSLSELKQDQEALLWFDQAVRRNRGDADSVYNRGVNLVNLGRNDQALRDFRTAARRDPTHVYALYNIGTLLLQTDQPTQAQVILRQALIADPANSAILNNLGVALFRTKRYREAISCYAAILDMDPSNAGAYFNQAAAFEQLGDLQNAVYLAKKAIKRGGAPASYHFHLGRFLMRLHQKAEALHAFEKALLLDPQCGPAFIAAASVAFELHYFQRGRGYLYKGLELEPSNVSGQVLHAVVLMNSGRHDDAYGICKALLEKMPTDPDTLMLKVELLIKMDRLDEAVRYAELLSKREKHDCNILFNLGMVFGHLGRFKLSVKCLRRALKLNPEDSQALTNLGVALINDGQIEEAIRSFVSALELDPKDVTAAKALTKIVQFFEGNEPVPPN
jgi:tetratricopeptide (TPR) repeat protein